MPGVNPFDPFGFTAAWMRAWTRPAGPVYPRQPSIKPGTPIAIDARRSDPGLTVTTAKDAITIAGTARGPQRPRDALGIPLPYDYARGMSFSLDIDRAPTVDVNGRTDYTEKNQRLFTLTTSKGWSALECAQRLAAKVNAGDDFKAAVESHADGRATLRFTRR
jgi:hypothetical protein